MTGFVRVRAKVVTDSTGSFQEMPVLLTAAGPVLPLIKYLSWHYHARSLGWCDKVAMSTELLLEYTAANSQSFQCPEDLFSTFGQALYDGTIDAQTGIDPSGLYWRPRRTNDANVILGLLANMSDWLAKRGYAKPLNPPDIKPGGYDLALAMAAHEHRRSQAFLGHTRKSGYESHPIVRSIPRRRAAVIDDDDRPPSFPEEHFRALLEVGFIRRGFHGDSDWLTGVNSRDACITLLMHGAGLRLSECFHLWVQDVQADPKDGRAVVNIYHPSEGMAPSDWRDDKGKPAKNRADYLAMKYGLKPRNVIGGSMHAGWKVNLLDNSKTRSMRVHWRDDNYANIFMTLWRRVLAERSLLHCNHPYAFVSIKEGQRNDYPPGRPYTIKAYVAAHRRAVERIGLVVAKANGTTPHGHRHAMGQNMTDLQLQPHVIQKILHQKSLASQEPYTRPSLAKAAAALNAAQERLKALTTEEKILTTSLSDDLAKLIAHGFDGVSPRGLLPGAYQKSRRSRK